MRTIEKILWYPIVPEYNIELLKKWGFYNGTGADGVFFDGIINEVFKTLEKAKVFDSQKSFALRKDIQQLVIQHDILTGFKWGFFNSNRKLAYWLFLLLHNFPLKYRLIISLSVFYAVHCTKKAKNNYKLIK